MSGTRWIKTKRESIYKRLVANPADPDGESPDHEVYPFEFGYELFTLGLAVGYAEGEKYDGDYDGDGSHYRIVRLSQFGENNPHHMACIELFERLIILENEASEDGEDEITWEDIIAYTDQGVGFLNGEWQEDNQFDVEQHFSTALYEIEDRLDEFEDELTEPPTSGDQGGLNIG